MKRIILILLLFSSLGFLVNSCNGKKRTAKQVQKDLIQDQKLTINIFPFWGGSSNAVLERKNEKDVLINSWIYKDNGKDTTVTSFQSITKEVADSIFFYAGKIKWNSDVNYGTSEPTADTKSTISLKKGRFTNSVSWDRLKGVFELPYDLLKVVTMVNDISPAELKLY